MTDGITIEADIKRAEKVMADLMDASGVNPKAGASFVRRQCGLLAMTLINVTPPQNQQSTQSNIQRKSKKQFFAADKTSALQTGSENVWVGANTHHLVGVPRDFDMRGASTTEGVGLFYSTQPRKALERPFMGKPRHQKIWLINKWLISRATAARVVKRIQSHIGRKKAGWLPTWDACQPQSGRGPARLVTRHRAGARGKAVNGLGTPGKPTMTIINFAHGITSPETIRNVRVALRIRTKAMLKDAQLYIRGVKKKWKLR